MSATLQEFILEAVRNLESGELENFPDPANPSDLGTPLTQAEINTLKKIIKEITERYTPPFLP